MTPRFAKPWRAAGRQAALARHLGVAGAVGEALRRLWTMLAHQQGGLLKQVTLSQ